MYQQVGSAIELALNEFIADQPEPVQSAAKQLLAEIEIARNSEVARQQFEALRGRKNLKVHLGSGPRARPGWVNIDIIPPPAELPPDTVQIFSDLRVGPLPMDDGCAEYIYSSHFLEHLEYPAGLRLMRDCLRLLQPGGVFRAGLPDFKTSFRAYVEGDHSRFNMVNPLKKLPALEESTMSIVDHINFGVYQNGQHKCIYDEDKISLALKSVGFSSVDITDYKEGIDPGDKVRRRYSFYVEAVK